MIQGYSSAYLVGIALLGKVLEGSKSMPDSHSRQPSMDCYGNDTPPHVGEPLYARVDILAKEGSHRLHNRIFKMSQVFWNGMGQPL